MKIDFQKFEDEKAQIEAFLAQPEAYAAPDFAEKSRRLAEINDILGLAQKIEQARKNLAEATELVEDAELGEMAREDVRVLGLNIDAWTAELEENYYLMTQQMTNQQLWKFVLGQAVTKRVCLRESCIGCMYDMQSDMA